jgi:DNA-directed RNA polymerase subunit RPC12/RpoP
MQPVQFPCGHCGKLMAVIVEHRGRQVRCPHCQQVVVAPPPAAPAPVAGSAEAPPGRTETISHTPAAGEAEDIFSPADVSDDLFGRSEPPRIEMPPEPPAPSLPSDNIVPLPSAEATQASTPPEAAATMPSSLPPFSGNDGTVVLPAGGESSWMSDSVTETLGPPPHELPPTLPVDSAPASSTRLSRRTEPKTPWFLLLVFSPLLLYAIVITVFSLMLYRQEQDLEQRLRRNFETMPDEGDKPGVEKGKKVSLWKYDSRRPILPLPENLCTTLDQHQSLRIGELQVTPDRVERKRIKVMVEGANPEPCQGDSLVLYLKMKNLSSEYAFAPLDNYFDRSWHEGAQPPFTLLEVGNNYRFHGGPADWYPRGDRNHKREWIEGRNDQPDVLQPGEEKEMFVCTDGNNQKAVSVLFGEGSRPAYHGSFLWRVRVRRGLVRVQDKDYSATAVIGVRFTDKDIDDAAREMQ